MSFKLDDSYVDVAERIREFAAKYPDGSLQGEGYFVRGPAEDIIGYHYKAQAFRTPDDSRPGVGTAFEPIPGKTPYTKDSEVMNAETSAWGRAIVALGFATKKIASAEEVRNRQDGKPTSVAEVVAQNESKYHAPPDGGDPALVMVEFGKHKGKQLGDLDRGYLEWLVETFEAKNPSTRRVQAAAAILLGKDVPAAVNAPAGLPTDDDIPF